MIKRRSQSNHPEIPWGSRGLNSWVGSLGGNSALVALVASHLDVSGLTPSSSPGVLDDPVVSVFGISAVSYSQNTMIQGTAAAAGLNVDT